MGFKNLFKIKPPEEQTPEKTREELNELGVSTKSDLSARKSKFAAYGRFAADRKQNKTYAPPGYEQQAELEDGEAGITSKKEINADLESLNKAPFDPYTVSNVQVSQSGGVNPYSMANFNKHNSTPDVSNGYSYQNSPSSQYGQSASQQNLSVARGSNPYKDIAATDAYRSSGSATNVLKSNPYSSMRDEKYRNSPSVDYRRNYENQQPNGTSNTNYSGLKPTNSSMGNNSKDDELDLNEVINTSTNEDDDLNNSIHDGYNGDIDRGYQTFEEIQREQLLKQQQEEDYEVDEIKQQIRFTKQNSVASTRNTLKMAQDAELAGMNTLGMLGHQSEKLNNVERNLNLMKMQNRFAEDKVGELKKLNRNILAVHVGNPFTSKRRVREAEERTKAQRMAEKVLQEETTSKLLQSTNRIENAMTNHSENEVREKYQRNQALQRAKKYQFENDEEDDDMEAEIDKNLDKITQVSSRLKKLAIATGQEIDSQKDRIAKIEDDADELDIRIHLNTTRLTNIR